MAPRGNQYPCGVSKRRVKIISFVLLLPFLLLGVFLVFERVRGGISLARIKRSLAAQGEKLTLAEFVPKASSGEDNGAPALWQAVSRLATNGTVLPKNVPPRMRLTASGRAIVNFREVIWVEDTQTNSWQEVGEDLAKNEEALDEIRELLQKPVLRNPIDYSAGPQAYLGHLGKPRTLTRWFGASLQLALHQGRKEDALVDLLTQVSLPRCLAEDRLLISELVRIAVAAIARTDTWEALQAEGWTDSQLAQIQGAWEKERFSQNMVRGLEGELIYAQTALRPHAEVERRDRYQLFRARRLPGAGRSRAPMVGTNREALARRRADREILKGAGLLQGVEIRLAGPG